MAALQYLNSGTPWDQYIGTTLRRYTDPTVASGDAMARGNEQQYMLPDGTIVTAQNGILNMPNSPQGTYNGQSGYYGLQIDPTTGKITRGTFNTDTSMSTLDKLVAAGVFAGTGALMAGAGTAAAGTMGDAGLVEPAAGLGDYTGAAAIPGASAATRVASNVAPAAATTVSSLLSNPATLSTAAQLATGAQAADAASTAAQQQQAAADAAIAEQRRQYDTTRSDLMPWMTAGKETLASLMNQMPELTKAYTQADFQNDPGYQFQLSEGQKALDAAARARGGYGSSGALRELLRYSQGVASTGYQDAYNRDMARKRQVYNMLAGISGTGQATAGTAAQYGNDSSKTVSDLLTQSGNAQAAGTVGRANAWSNAVGNAVNNYQQQNWLNRVGSNLYGR